jgi:hypothetical protein
VLVTTSAFGGPAAFYSSDGGYAWQHAEKLGLTKTVDGYRITLERAYADANQMMLATTVVDTQNRGWRQVDVGHVSVVDSAGGDWTMATGISDPVTVTSAATISWFEHGPGPAGPGQRAFTVTVSSVSVRNQEDGPPANGLTWDPWHAVAVNASFSFELTVGGGSQANPRVSSESTGVTITLESIVTSPSTVRLELRMTGAPSSGTDWSPIVLVSQNGHNLDVEMQTSQIGGSLTTVYTSVGVEDPAGDWTVTASQLMGDGTGASNQGQDVRYDGNWTLHFSMP